VSYPERIVPARTSPGILALHLKRYEFARRWCESAEVLDAACGVGYGSAHLAETARSVVGIDRSAEALAHARSAYALPNVEFVEGDLLALPFPYGAFDVVCAFEVIEHLDDQRAFLREVARVLGENGTLLVSTPRVERTNREPANPFHRIELSPGDFEALLRERFGEVELYGQRRLQTRRHRLAQRLDVFELRRRLPVLRRVSQALGTPPTVDVGLEGIAITRDRLDDASELVAVCRRPRPG
jgi:SAM-dependent methyltransferase